MNTESTTLKPSIGFIGMGHMGSHMAKRLLDAGYQVTVYGRTEEKAREVGQRGALVVNTLLGLGMQALAEAIALGEKAGVEKGLLLDVLGQTAVLTPGQKSKLENVRREQYPTNFALSLMHKDLSLVLSQAYDISVSMPATAAAQQMYTAALAKGMDADFSLMIQFMEELAGLSTRSEEQRRK
jgi:3-hydroxyisobutyrate dehydrogenase-like beta-hydroxyacid dehydrogenase